ncbi:MAG: chromosome segregation ATPase-like protein [Rhizobium sp.]|nr:chromosome segregation ATPase-like protein [Rhizobium sp.]
MLTSNTLIFLLLGIGLFGLIGIQLFFAIFHDRVVSAAGPQRALEALLVDIESKRDLLRDVETELAERRKRLENIADIQAEYDATKRQFDELKLEWTLQDEKRAEIRKLTGEMETALAEKATVDADLATARLDLEAAQDRIFAAERMFAQIEFMKAELADLERQITALREEKRELADAEARLDEINRSLINGERELAQVNGRVEAARDELELMRGQQAAERAAAVDARSELTNAAAKLAAAQEQINSTERSVETLEEKRAALLAKIAHLEELAGDAAEAGADPDVAKQIDDRLKELKLLPPVLTGLRGWKDRAPENEADALKHVNERLKLSGLDYPDRIIKAFHTAMKVNETAQLAVLAGISGTGKSQLPRQYAAAMGIGFLQVPVQPRWDSPQDLMGFYNYIEKRFRPTDMARALYQLDYLNNPESEFQDRMLMVLLDEMNLARVEYYFSDFLSRLESRPSAKNVENAELRKDAEIELEIPMPRGREAPRIFPGYNLLFAGTMNEDESTQSLSDKVVDRANVLRFAAPTKLKTATVSQKLPEPQALSAKRWSSWVRDSKDVEPRVQSSVNTMIELMGAFKRPFGHRLGKAIVAYVANYPLSDRGSVLNAPLADQVEMRLLPKLRGLEVHSFDEPFSKLRDFVATDLQDDALAQAIENSRQTAQDGSGQFVWNGVVR